MCSILGIIDQCNKVDYNFLCQLNETLDHRGPDSSGIWLEENVGFAHNRLAIQDLSESGHQPMISKSERFILCFNGEIYNHLEIRKGKLSSATFKGHSDTETLVELLAQEISAGGVIENAINMCNGMFSFSLWDRDRKELYLVRDRIGIKPLYYYSNKNVLMFSSELKPFWKSNVELTVSESGIKTYLTYGHSCWPNTILKDVYQVQPGHYLKISNNGVVDNEYWSAIELKNNYSKSYEDAFHELDELINDSVKLRMISDVPFGAFLSGGIDSSLIVSLMQKHHGGAINTFSVGFETGSKNVYEGGKYSELNDARKVSEQIGSIHHEITPSSTDLVNNIERIVYHYDEPFGDPAAFPTYLVSELAKQKVTVCASGEGADELFGGYRRYKANLWYHNHKIMSRLFTISIDTCSPFLPRLRRFRKLAEVYKGNNNAPETYSKWLHLGKNLLKEEGSINSQYQKIWDKIGHDIEQFPLLADQCTWLVDSYLKKLDNASMAHSLEGRVPFLDHRLVEFANTLKVDWKYKSDSKKILKDVAMKYIPKEIIQKSKRGFTVPLDEWIRNDLNDYFMQVLFDSNEIYDAYSINKNTVESLHKEHVQMKRDNSYILWHIAMLSIWHQKWIVDKNYD